MCSVTRGFEDGWNARPEIIYHFFFPEIIFFSFRMPDLKSFKYLSNHYRICSARTKDFEDSPESVQARTIEYVLRALQNMSFRALVSTTYVLRALETLKTDLRVCE